MGVAASGIGGSGLHAGATQQEEDLDEAAQQAVNWGRVKAYMASTRCIPQGLENHEAVVTVTLDRAGRVRSPWPGGIVPAWDATRGELILLHQILVLNTTILAGPGGSEVVTTTGGEATPPYAQLHLAGEWVDRAGPAIAEERAAYGRFPAGSPRWEHVFRRLGWRHGEVHTVSVDPHFQSAPPPGTRRNAMYIRPGPSNEVLSHFLASRPQWTSGGRVRVRNRTIDSVPVVNPVLWFMLQHGVVDTKLMRPDASGQHIQLAIATLDGAQATVREAMERAIAYISVDGLRLGIEWHPAAAPDALLIVRLGISYMRISVSGAGLDVEETEGSGVVAPEAVPNTTAQPPPPATPAPALPPPATMTTGKEEASEGD